MIVARRACPRGDGIINGPPSGGGRKPRNLPPLPRFGQALRVRADPVCVDPCEAPPPRLLDSIARW